jgi:hypothetical protein
MIDKTASLTVHLSVPTNRRWSTSLPIEVRDAKKLVCVARGISDGKLAVPAGNYFVTAMLPDGQQVAAENIVEIAPGEDKIVPLSLSDIEFPASLESKNTWGDAVKDFAQPVTRYFSRVNYTIITGNWLGARMGAGSANEFSRAPTTRTSLDVKFSGQPTWIEVTQGDQNTYLAVPVDGDSTTTVKWGVNETGKLDLDFDFSNGAVNSFFDFIQSDQTFEAQSVSQSINQQATQAILEKRLSPLRAVLGAYVLVRFSQRDDMDDWTAKLVEIYPWLPDALAIRIEYLARNGKHAEAARLLLEVPKRGTPWFRSGIGYVEKRANLYARLGEGGRSGLELDGTQLELVKHIAGTFSKFASALDMTQFTTVLRGIERIA